MKLNLHKYLILSLGVMILLTGCENPTGSTTPAPSPEDDGSSLVTQTADVSRSPSSIDVKFVAPVRYTPPSSKPLAAETVGSANTPAPKPEAPIAPVPEPESVKFIQPVRYHPSQDVRDQKLTTAPQAGAGPASVTASAPTTSSAGGAGASTAAAPLTTAAPSTTTAPISVPGATISAQPPTVQQVVPALLNSNLSTAVGPLNPICAPGTSTGTTGEKNPQAQGLPTLGKGVTKIQNQFDKKSIAIIKDRYKDRKINYMPESALRFFDREDQRIPSFDLSSSKVLESCRLAVKDSKTSFALNHKSIDPKHPFWVHTKEFDTFEETTGKLHTSGTAATAGSYVEGTISHFAGPFDTGLNTRDPKRNNLPESGALDRSIQLTKRGFKWAPLTDPKSGAIVKDRYGVPIEYATERTPDYGCAMRWDQVLKDEKGNAMKFPFTNSKGQSFESTYQYIASKRILIYDSVKKTAVVCKPMDWGPARKTKHIMDVTPDVFEGLGHVDAKGETGHIQVSIAPDEMKLGPVEPQMDCSSPEAMARSGALENSASPMAKYYPPHDAKRFAQNGSSASHASVSGPNACAGGAIAMDTHTKDRDLIAKDPQEGPDKTINPLWRQKADQPETPSDTAVSGAANI